MARSLISYPFVTGELSEPWRLETGLRVKAQSYLDGAAKALRHDPHSLSVEEAYDIYADALCHAIAINLGNLVITPANVFLLGTEDSPEWRNVQ